VAYVASAPFTIDVDAYARVPAPAALSAAASFGASIEAVGDLDEDGTTDFVVGAPYHSEGGDVAPCAGEVGAPAAYDGDCAGAFAVVSGAALSLLEDAPIDDSCVELGTAGQRLGAAARAVERLPNGEVRIAVGAPGHSENAGAAFLYTLSMDAGICSMSREALRSRGLVGDRFGFTFGM
jgi:hypothetical protein